MNISSALIKQVITFGDSETWSYLKRDYLPTAYYGVFDRIEKHINSFHHLPNFDELKLGIRDNATLEKVLSIESVEVDVDPWTLLEYLKNEYTQEEILKSLDSYVDRSILFGDAKETVDELHKIVLEMEDKVDLQDPETSMQAIDLFDSEDELARRVRLGLNNDYDAQIDFSSKALIMFGGKRGSGKSFTCANLAVQAFERGKSSIYFTIEMDSRETLQRMVSIATKIPIGRVATKNLSVTEWEQVAEWWSSRFDDGEKHLQAYREHRNFGELHQDLKGKSQLKDKQQLDIVYDSGLTLSRIRAELDKKVITLEPEVIIVDYINQVQRGFRTGKPAGQYDWTEQIEIAKALKKMAQDYNVPVISPYQTDATGEARFAKGLLDAADAAYALKPHEDCIEFECAKMRSAKEISFTSVVDWDCLRIGPESAIPPSEREKAETETGEAVNDLPW